MSISSVEFPLSPIRAGDGVVPEPIIPVLVMTFEGFKSYDFLVDSGADISLLPFSLAKEIGVNLKRCRISTTLGVEGRGIKIYHASVLIRLGRWPNRIRCAFAQHDRIPPLLGRLDLFSHYNITFHAGKRSIIFRKLNN